jgi:amino acid transporter
MSATTTSTDIPAPNRATPKPALSVFDAVMIITGIVIGTGIFGLTPFIAGVTGSPEWMFGAWMIGAVLSLIGALCYAELATTFPSAGGDYHFLTRAYGKDVSFFFAWARIAVITTGPIAVAALVFGDYMSRVWALGANSSAIYAALTVVVLTAVNVAGLRESARTQNILTLLLLIGMVAVVVGSIAAPASAAAPTASAASGIPATLGLALVLVLFAFGGWNEAAYVSAEVRGGSRSIVRALVIAIAVITAIYLLFIWGLVNGLGFEGLKASKAAAADVAKHAFGVAGEKIVAAVVALAALTTANATMIVGARTNYAAANDWPLLSFMSRWDGARAAPLIAFLVQGAIALFLVLFAAVDKGGVQSMVEFTAAVFWFFIMLTGVALIVLRFKFAHVPRPFKVPLYPILPIVFICTCAYMVYSALVYAQSKGAVQISLYLMLAGLVAWIVVRLKRSS